MNLSVLRRQTDRFIAERPSDIALTRTGLSDDGAGGFTAGTAPLDAQTFRLISQGYRTGDRQTVDGRVVSADFVLLGSFDADVAIGDSFAMDTRQYEVVYVRPTNGYETWAEVSYRG